MMESAPAAARRADSYWLTRFIILRLLGAVYAVAFLVAARQILPLIGSDGLTPVNIFVGQNAGFDSFFQGFIHFPSLSFDPLDLVNTYGAFGSVGQQRLTVVFEGTDVAAPNSDADWQPYLYIAQPVAIDKRPVQIAPYQPRLDWQMWFAAMARPSDYPWTLNLVWKLLHNDPGALSLFENNPFPDAPPRYIRAVLYSYTFAPPGNPEHLWWNRKELGLWLPPLFTDDPHLLNILKEAGWMSGN